METHTLSSKDLSERESHLWQENTLRPPLDCLLSCAAFGLKRAATAPPTKLRDSFQHIDHNSRVLLLWLNDLLDLAKWEAGCMPHERPCVDLRELLATVVDAFHALTAAKRLTLLCSLPNSPLDLPLDPHKIMHVLRNLLSNAVKVSPDGQRTEISLRWDAAAIVVGVHDHAVGIPEGELVTIFDQFVPSSRTKTGTGGTRLGLAICRKIVTAHHGRIWAEQRRGGGIVTLRTAAPRGGRDRRRTSRQRGEGQAAA